MSCEICGAKWSSLQFPADPDSIVEPEAPPPNCLPSISLPRILSGNDRERQRPQKFVRLTRPPAGSSVRQRELLPPLLPLQEEVPEGAPANGASLVRSPLGSPPANPSNVELKTNV